MPSIHGSNHFAKIRQNMSMNLGNLVDRWSGATILGCLALSAACALTLLAGWGGAPVAEFIGAWSSIPLVVAVAVFLWPVINDQTLPRLRRRAFQLIFAAEVL